MKALTDKIVDILKGIVDNTNAPENKDWIEGVKYAIEVIEIEEEEANFSDVARVVVKHFRAKHYGPHHKAIIDRYNAELMVGIESTGESFENIKN